MTDRYGLWRGGPPLLLASASAIRRQLLDDAGVPVESEAAGVDERAVEKGLSGQAPEDVATSLAQAKALAVSARHPGRLVLGADQTLALGAAVLHKPRDRADARRHLEAFSGRIHHLHAALALVRGGQVLWSHVDSAAMQVRTLTPAFIEAYLDVAGADVLSSVGAYRLEAHGAHLFDLIEGQHSTILGLPLFPLLAELRRQGCVAA